jgi:putative ABC transport system permease protein
MGEALLQSIQNLRANKLRSFLTMFGIVWGVVSIVLLAAMGEGFQRGNLATLHELGKNIVIIRNGRTSMQAGGQRAGRMIRLTFGDVLALQQKSKLLEFVSPELMRGAVSVKSAFNSNTLQMSGVWPVYQTIRTIEVDRGRLMTEVDNDDGRRVVIVGYEASRLLFAERDPVGSALTLNGLTYTVIGRVRKKTQQSSYTGQDDDRLFVPYNAMRQDFPFAGESYTPDSLSAIIAAPYQRVADQLGVLLEREGAGGAFALGGRTPVEAEIRAILAPRHGFDPNDVEALSFWNTAIEAVMFSIIIRSMREFFISVSVITLVLGGIGVMNIMLVAVRERTREIGIRRAIGATARLIQWQFFAEGLSLTFMSGALGFLIGWLLCQLVNVAPMPSRFAGMIVTWQTAAFAVAALSLIGVAAATYPARRAAAMPPIEALRYEM